MGRTYSYDSNMVISDGAAAYTASGVGQVASASKYLKVWSGGDVRSDLGIIGATAARSDFACVVNISALTNTTDGEYGLFILGSNSSSGTTPVILGGQVVGLGSTLPNGSGTTAQTDVLGTGSTTTTGRREILFSTEQNGIFYQYIYLYVNCYGSTSKSITLTAYVAKLPLE